MNSRMKRWFSLPRLGFLLLLGALLGVGWLAHDDYGISWDEQTQLEIGQANYRYVVKGDPGLFELKDRHYGALFEVFLVRVAAQGSSRDMYLSRHWWTFLAFAGGVVGFFLLLEKATRRAWLALTGCLLLVLSPRIFADAFYNSKDIPFLSASVWGMLALLHFAEKPGWRRLALLALASAVMIALRVPGIFILGIALALLARESLAGRLRLTHAAALAAGYLLLSAALTVGLYPILWHDPLGEFRQALVLMSNFPNQNPVLYQGSYILPQQLPWHYLPIWIGITTPPAYLLLTALGAAATFAGWLKQPRRLLAVESTPWLAVSLWLFAPWLAVLLLGSALYDGWRQMFFIYPALLAFSVRGWGGLAGTLSSRAGNRPAGKWLAGLALAAALLPAAAWMAREHPYQNLYFNRLAGKDMQTVKMNFELDYWGLSHREGLEALLRLDPRPRIKIYADSPVALRTAAILYPEDEMRLDFVSQVEQADYFIGNYRWHREDYPYHDEVFSVWMGNARVLSIFRLRGESNHANPLSAVVEQRFCQRNGFAGIRGVAVGADFFGVGSSHWRAPDHHFDFFTQPGCLDRLQGNFHVRHGGG
jgi:hypothetical protein